jgi:hypothetical protein
MKLWYHNHNFEFTPKPGGRPIEILWSVSTRSSSRSKWMSFWVSMAGANPVVFIRQNVGRIVAVHLKDCARKAVVPRFHIASVPKNTYQGVGSGELNFAEILRASSSAKVMHYFVEQDHSPGVAVEHPPKLRRCPKARVIAARRSHAAHRPRAYVPLPGSGGPGPHKAVHRNERRKPDFRVPIRCAHFVRLPNVRRNA